jgi:hypothetical protein
MSEGWYALLTRGLPTLNIIIVESYYFVSCIHPLFLISYCHNPTNNPKQLKATFVGVVLLSVRKNHTTTTTTTTTTTPRCHYILRQPRKTIFGMQPYFNPTR